MITISSDHNAARLEGSRVYIDTGANPAKLCFYGSTRVALTSTPTTPPLSTIELANPSGAVDATGYHLVALDDGLNMSTGVALWVRLYTRSGAAAVDFDVRATTDPVEYGEIVLEQTTLFAGGVTRLVSATLL